MFCTRCEQELPISEFKERGDRPGHYRSWCIQCGRNSANEWRKENPEKEAENVRKWVANNRERSRVIKTKYRETHREELRAREKMRAARDPEKEHARLIAIKRKLKAEMIDAYGGKCACCGEDRFEFLTLEHKNGDGAADRKRHGSTDTIIRRLRDAGWPKDNYTILCWNCNSAKGMYGYCPHEKEREGVDNGI